MTLPVSDSWVSAEVELELRIELRAYQLMDIILSVKVSMLCSVYAQIPSSEIFIDSLPPVYSHPEMEQIIVLAVCGRQSRCKSGLFLGNLHTQFIPLENCSFVMLILI